MRKIIWMVEELLIQDGGDDTVLSDNQKIIGGVSKSERGTGRVEQGKHPDLCIYLTGNVPDFSKLTELSRSEVGRISQSIHQCNPPCSYTTVYQ